MKRLITMNAVNAPHMKCVSRPQLLIARLLCTLYMCLLAACGSTTVKIKSSDIVLAPSDVGSQFAMLVDTTAGPTQRGRGIAYQQDFVDGHFRYFMTQMALTGPGNMQIIDWENAHDIPITTPFITIIGPFVASHSGIFVINSSVIQYISVDSARKDYHCCIYNYPDNFTDFHMLPVSLGDEAEAFTGISHSPDPDPNNNMQIIAIHWRHGKFVAFLSILGVHDITLPEAQQLAQIVEGRIAKEASQ